MHYRKRYLSLAVIVLFIAAALVVDYLPMPQTQAQQKGVKGRTDREKLARKAKPSGTVTDRLDKDDGYGIGIFFSATVHGNLEVCGCPIHPLGGVARRAGYLKAFAERSPGVAMLQVDAGNIFSDERNDSDKNLRQDARLMNDWIVRADDVLGLDVLNLSYKDIDYAASFLKPDATLKPGKSAVISSNIRAVDGAHLSPEPYVIRIVTGKRLARPVRIAFIGVSDTAPDEMKDRVAASGFVINDPFESVKAALAEVADKADVNVVVSFLSLPRVNKLARLNDDIDVIINSDETGLVPDPGQVNNALIVFAAKETKHLGELRVYTDADGVVDRFTARYVELDEVIPDEPGMAAITAQARREIDEVQNRMAEAEAAVYSASNSSNGRSPFVLSDACGKCHQTEYAIWRKSLHSKAFAALETRRRTFDSACIGCHSLGFQKQGFVNIKATPHLANVQCESCHGPGAAHAAAPAAGNYKTPARNASCLVCHDRANSPDFDFAKYWPVIAHSNSLKKKGKGLKAKG